MPNIPNYSETDTRAKLINPALYIRGWTEDHIRREENAGSLYKYRGRWRRDQKFADYLLRIPIGDNPEPVAIAVIEAKRNRKPVTEGFTQAKEYASAKRLNLPFTFASNGYRFIHRLLMDYFASLEDNHR